MHDVEHPGHEVTIAMFGKYVDLSDSYKSLNEALIHAGIQTHARVNIHYVDSEEIDASHSASSAAWTASSSPAASASAASRARSAPRYAREHRMPYLGICLGMQLATIEYARHKPGSRTPTAPSSTPTRRIR